MKQVLFSILTWIVAAITGVAYVVGEWVVEAYVVMTLWNWYGAAYLKIADLPFTFCMGLMFLINMVFQTNSYPKWEIYYEERVMKMRVVPKKPMDYALPYLRPLFVLALGTILHEIILRSMQ